MRYSPPPVPADRPESDGPARRLWNLWRQGWGPDLAAFLAGAGELTRLGLLGVLRVDQRERWLRGERAPAEAYLERHAALRADDALALDLIYSEFLLREELGESPAPDEYAGRFPAFAEEFRRQVEVHRAAFPPGPSAPPSGDRPTVPAAGEVEPGLPRVPGYEVLGELGRGGMGVVYKARQVGLDRLVALKMIRGGPVEAEQRQRFRAEAVAAARLRHPNIVQIYEVGEHAGRPYFSMEYVEGGSLDRHLTGAPQPAPEAARLVETLARAVHAAHQCGIVHRDLKPANVLLQKNLTQRRQDAKKDEEREDEGSLPPSSSLGGFASLREALPKITDFGLAKQLDADLGQTRSGAILGTPSYMAPEQAAGRAAEIGPATDVYALGAILYELLTGRPPFTGTAVLETLEQVRSQEPVPPRRLRPNLPRDLETVCLKCLEKDPRRRYGSAEDVAEDLARFLQHRPVVARPVGAAVRLGRWCRRNPVPAALAGLVALLLLVLAAGGPIAAFTFQRQVARAEGAERDSQEELLHSKLAQARAGRWSGQAGGRVEGLAALAEAARLARALGRGEDTFQELRNEAVACLALTDLRLGPGWEGNPPGTNGWAFDARYQRYARSDRLGTVSVRGVGDDRELFRLVGEAAEQATLRFSPTGRFLAAKFFGPTGDDQRLYVWDLSAGGAAPRAYSPVPLAAWDFSPDEQYLAVGFADCSIGLHDPATGKELRHLAPGLLPNRLAFSPDGRRLAITSRVLPGLEVRDAETGRVLQTLGNSTTLYGVCWHPDGNLLAVGCEDRHVYVWNTRTAALEVTLAGHQAEVVDVAYSHDGDLLGSVSPDGTLRLWDAQTGRQLGTSPGAAWVQFSPDDRTLGAVTKGGQVQLCELVGDHEWVQRQGPRGDGGGPTTADFSPDGRLLASVGRSGVKFWDLGTRAEVARVPVQYAACYLFSPDGDALITCTYRGLRRWPARTEEPGPGSSLRVGPPRPLSESDKAFLPQAHRATWGPGAHWLAVADDGHDSDEVLLVHLEKPAERLVLHGLPQTVSVSRSADGRWVAVGGLSGPGVRIWDAGRGEYAHELAVGPACVAFSPDGRWLVTGTAEEYRWWHAGTWQPGPRLPRRQARRPGPLAFTPDGRALAVVGSEAAVQLVEPATGREIAALAAPDPLIISGLFFSPDGSRLAVTGETVVFQVWDLRQVRGRLQEMGLEAVLPAYPAAPAPGPAAPRSVALLPEPEEVRRLEGHRDWVFAVAFSPDGRRVLSGGGGGMEAWRWYRGSDWAVRVWDVEAGTERRRFEAHTEKVRCLAFAPDGRRALSGGNDRTVRLWDVETGREIRRFAGNPGDVLGVAFSPDGRRFLSGSWGVPPEPGAVWLWDVASGQVLRRFEVVSGQVAAVALSPDGRLAASGHADGTARLWDVDSGREVRCLVAHPGVVQAVAFSPDGRRLLASTSEGAAILWDTDTGQEVRRLTPFGAGVVSVAFSPEGRRALTSTLSGVVQLWDLGTGQEVHRYEGHAGCVVSSVAFSPDGRRAVSGGSDGTVRVWRLPDP